MADDENDWGAPETDGDEAISHLKSDGEMGEMPEEEVPYGEEVSHGEAEKGSLTWWFGADKPWRYSRRSPFRKLMIGITLFVCLAFMVNQTLCASGPL